MPDVGRGGEFEGMHDMRNCNCNEIAMASYDICHWEISCESSDMDTRASDQPPINL
jgi:hypothetical protein